MSVSVREADFDCGAEIAALSAGPEAGAVASFVGCVRGGSGEHAITSMTLEHYPGMTEKALEAIELQARERWNLLGVTIIHRVGRLVPGDRIVLVVVASRHRGEAFVACEFIMDYLKTRAPFWKREDGPGGTHWVDARESDEAARERWE
jgi:molybdopterin synthase catalytic subunit